MPLVPDHVPAEWVNESVPDEWLEEARCSMTMLTICMASSGLVVLALLFLGWRYLR